MYFWNTKALATRLKEGTLTQGEKLPYFLFFVAISYLIYEINFFPNGSEPSEGIEDLVHSGLTICLGVLGTFLCYRVNKEGDNSEFIDRFICLNFPVCIKIILIYIGIFGILVIADEEIGGVPQWLDEESFFISSIIEVIYYWRMWVAIRWTAHPRTVSES